MDQTTLSIDKQYHKYIVETIVIGRSEQKGLMKPFQLLDKTRKKSETIASGRSGPKNLLAEPFLVGASRKTISRPIPFTWTPGEDLL